MKIEFQVTQNGFGPFSLVDKSGNPFPTENDAQVSLIIKKISSFCYSGNCPAKEEGRCVGIGLVRQDRTSSGQKMVHILNAYGEDIFESDCEARGRHII